VAKSKIASLVADVFANTEVAENKVYSFTDYVKATKIEAFG